MTENRYREFWGWFESKVLPTLARREVPTRAMIDELDSKIVELSLSWELGPAIDDGGGWALAVSFGADLERLVLAEAMVNAAPHMLGCQILLGMPPKRWNGVLDLPSINGSTRFYTSEWLCFVLPMNGGMAIMVSPRGVEDGVDEDTLARAVAIAVQSELGERSFAEHVRDLSIVDEERTKNLPGIRCRMSELRATTYSR